MGREGRKIRKFKGRGKADEGNQRARRDMKVIHSDFQNGHINKTKQINKKKEKENNKKKYICN